MLCVEFALSIAELTRIESNNKNLMDFFIGPNINRVYYININWAFFNNARFRLSSSSDVTNFWHFFCKSKYADLKVFVYAHFIIVVHMHISWQSSK